MNMVIIPVVGAFHVAVECRYTGGLDEYIRLGQDNWYSFENFSYMYIPYIESLELEEAYQSHNSEQLSLF
jgi:hypothetical protein